MHLSCPYLTVTMQHIMLFEVVLCYKKIKERRNSYNKYIYIIREIPKNV